MPYEPAPVSIVQPKGGAMPDFIKDFEGLPTWGKWGIAAAVVGVAALGYYEYKKNSSTTAASSGTTSTTTTGQGGMRHAGGGGGSSTAQATGQLPIGQLPRGQLPGPIVSSPVPPVLITISPGEPPSPPPVQLQPVGGNGPYPPPGSWHPGTTAIPVAATATGGAYPSYGHAPVIDHPLHSAVMAYKRPYKVA